MVQRAYSYWMDSLNLFVGIHRHAYHAWGDLDLLSERYLFHRRTIWIIRYVGAILVQGPSLFYFAIFWPGNGWFVLLFLTFNLLIYPPLMFWLLFRLHVIKRNPLSSAARRSN